MGSKSEKDKIIRYLSKQFQGVQKTKKENAQDIISKSFLKKNAIFKCEHDFYSN